MYIYFFCCLSIKHRLYGEKNNNENENRETLQYSDLTNCYNYCQQNRKVKNSTVLSFSVYFVSSSGTVWSHMAL